MVFTDGIPTFLYRFLPFLYEKVPIFCPMTGLVGPCFPLLPVVISDDLYGRSVSIPEGPVVALRQAAQVENAFHADPPLVISDPEPPLRASRVLIPAAGHLDVDGENPPHLLSLLAPRKTAVLTVYLPLF